MDEPCFVCAKHDRIEQRDDELAPGGPVGIDELVVVSHLSPNAPGGDGRPVYLGHLLVEPRRHAAGLADLTELEAAAIGRWCTWASRALLAAGAEHVYAAVIGDAVAHLHVHLLARYPGTPREFWWQRVVEWPQASRGTKQEVAGLVARLRALLLESAKPEDGDDSRAD